MKLQNNSSYLMRKLRSIFRFISKRLYRYELIEEIQLSTGVICSHYKDNVNKTIVVRTREKPSATKFVRYTRGKEWDF